MARLSRRALLVDLGRVTLGAVVLGGVAGCADGDPGGEDAAPDTGTGTAATGGDAPAADEQASGEEGTAAAVDASFQRASFGFVSAYVLVRDDEAVLFDTGTGEDVAPITAALEAAGSGWDAVGHVVVSHEHPDHVGGLDAVLAEAPDAATYAAVPDLDRFRDRAGDPREVVDGDRVLDLTVVATPGHTAGHISLLDERAGLLLVGDALVNGVAIGGASGEGIEVSPPEFTADAEAAAASASRLAGLTFDTALFGHGEPVRGDADAEVAAAVG